MADVETWPDIAHMTREELEAEVAALRHALNESRDEQAQTANRKAYAAPSSVHGTYAPAEGGQRP